jgi:hypothetical protein
MRTSSSCVCFLIAIAMAVAVVSWAADACWAAEAPAATITVHVDKPGVANGQTEVSKTFKRLLGLRQSRRHPFENEIGRH